MPGSTSLEADGSRLVLRVGTGLFADLQGSYMSASEGLAGAISETGQADHGR